MKPFSSASRIVAGNHISVAHLVAETIPTFIDRLARKAAQDMPGIETPVGLIVEEVRRRRLMMQLKVIGRRMVRLQIRGRRRFVTVTGRENVMHRMRLIGIVEKWIPSAASFAMFSHVVRRRRDALQTFSSSGRRRRMREKPLRTLLPVERRRVGRK